MRSTCSIAILVVLAFTYMATSSTVALTRETPQADARALSGELMSPLCPGLLLTTCRSDGARALREEIAARFEAGESREAILDDLVIRFGEGIRTMPEPRGIGLVAWLTPGVLAVCTFAVLVQSLRRGTAGRLAVEPGTLLGEAEDDPQTTTRLDDELRDLD
jgi:cytochrome c-type biogenesis protein CcmH/NrfF